MNESMLDATDEFAGFADHPRYGRRPRFTGLKLDPLDPSVQLHWSTLEPHELVARFETATSHKWPYGMMRQFFNRRRRIEGTAVSADLTCQTGATVPVTHYFDLVRECRDCARSFIFFAVEQKHWYEELGFGLDSDCVRCAECRKRQQRIASLREAYETLFHVAHKTREQCLEMADACLSLIELGVFTKKQTQRVRMLLNSVRGKADIHNDSICDDLLRRIRLAERTDAEPSES